MVSLLQVHCLLVPLTLWYGDPEVARRLMTFLYLLPCKFPEVAIFCLGFAIISEVGRRYSLTPNVFDVVFDPCVSLLQRESVRDDSGYA